ncbi:hypothetical protein FQN60_004659, partial [Etheostoma spectabile]
MGLAQPQLGFKPGNKNTYTLRILKRISMDGSFYPWVRLWHLAVRLEGNFTVCTVYLLVCDPVCPSPLGLSGELARVANVPLGRGQD